MKHVALHNPARVLRQVAATRRQVVRCAEVLEFASHHTTVESCDEVDAILAGATLRDLASVFSDRPGYRPEWAPS